MHGRLCRWGQARLRGRAWRHTGAASIEQATHWRGAGPAGKGATFRAGTLMATQTTEDRISERLELTPEEARLLKDGTLTDTAIQAHPDRKSTRLNSSH